MWLEPLESRRLCSTSTFGNYSPVAIRDYETVASDVYVSGMTGNVVDVNVRLDANHTYDGDLDAYLVGPDGRVVELFTDVGGSQNDFRATVLDDQAGTGIANGAAPFAGGYRPEGPLSMFNDRAPNGRWRLEILDDGGWDQGQLNWWEVTITTASAPPPATGDTDDQISEARSLGVSRQVYDQVANGTDVDVYAFTLHQGEQLTLDVDSGFDPTLHVFPRSPQFDSNGRALPLAYADDIAAPGEAAGLDPYLEFVAPYSGTFYAAVAGYGNRSFNPVTGQGDTTGSAGAYGLFTNRASGINWDTAHYRESNALWQRGYAPSWIRSNSQIPESQGNCVWYVFGRARELGYRQSDLDYLGQPGADANVWDNRARTLGMAVATRVVDLRAGERYIAQSDTMASGLGHVAVVEEVRGDGTFVVSESLYGGPGIAWRTRVYSASTSPFTNFIQLRR